MLPPSLPCFLLPVPTGALLATGPALPSRALDTALWMALSRAFEIIESFAVGMGLLPNTALGPPLPLANFCLSRGPPAVELLPRLIPLSWLVLDCTSLLSAGVPADPVDPWLLLRLFSAQEPLLCFPPLPRCACACTGDF